MRLRRARWGQEKEGLQERALKAFSEIRALRDRCSHSVHHEMCRCFSGSCVTARTRGEARGSDGQGRGKDATCIRYVAWRATPSNWRHAQHKGPPLIKREIVSLPGFRTSYCSSVGDGGGVRGAQRAVHGWRDDDALGEDGEDPRHPARQAAGTSARTTPFRDHPSGPDTVFVV